MEKKVSIDSVFKEFSSILNKEEADNDITNDIINQNDFHIGMAFKLANSQERILGKLQGSVSAMNTYSIDQLRQFSIVLSYHRSVFHLEAVKLNSRGMKDVWNKYANRSGNIDKLSELLKYFEDNELYEKCAVIKKVIDILEKNK